MGTDIILYREIKIGNKWYCIEPKRPVIYDDYVDFHHDCMDLGRDYSFFNILCPFWGTHSAESIDYERGEPSGCTIELKGTPKSWLSYKDIDDYILKWRKDLEETESIELEFFDDDAEAKIERFNNSARKKSKEEYLQFYLKMYDEESKLVKFRKELDNVGFTAFSWENKTYKNMQDIPTDCKRIVFYFSS